MESEMKLMHGDLSERILAAGIEVHREVGPGLLESTYEACMARELQLMGIPHKRQLKLPIIYKGVELPEAYRIDLLVDEKVVIEVKAVEKLEPIHEAQLMTYLKLSGYRVGILMNFNTIRLKDGIKRFVK